VDNFFGLSRDILKHWVYKDIYAFRVWMHILLRTQYSKDQTQNLYNGCWITQEYGEFIYGRESWSKQLQVPEQRLRTIMKKFEKEGMICNTKKVYPKCSLLSVANYAKFNRQPNQQSNQQNSLQPSMFDGYANQQSNQSSTGDQPAINRRSTTIKKEKKEKNIIDGDLEPKCETIQSVIEAYTPEIFLREALLGWSEMRTKKRKPLTPRAMSLALKALDKLSGDKTSIVDYATLKSWESFYNIPDYQQTTLQKGGSQLDGIPMPVRKTARQE